MANFGYPDTTLQPLQTVDFILENGSRIRTMLKPKRDESGSLVGHVEMEWTNVGCTTLMPVDLKKGDICSLMDAGQMSVNFAKHEADKAGQKIIEIALEGEEFLEKSDLESLFGSSIDVKIV